MRLALVPPADKDVCNIVNQADEGAGNEPGKTAARQRGVLGLSFRLCVCMRLFVCTFVCIFVDGCA
jgi:hypothetical protein